MYQSGSSLLSVPSTFTFYTNTNTFTYSNLSYDTFLCLYYPISLPWHYIPSHPIPSNVPHSSMISHSCLPWPVVTSPLLFSPAAPSYSSPTSPVYTPMTSPGGEERSGRRVRRQATKEVCYAGIRKQQGQLHEPRVTLLEHKERLEILHEISKLKWRF